VYLKIKKKLQFQI